MKKEQLILLLQTIEGNPDILIWNSLVSDYMDICPKLIDTELVKESKQHFLKCVELENYRLGRTSASKDELDRLYKNREWDFPNPYFAEDELKDYCGRNRKKVVLINVMNRGKLSFDRNGSIRY